MLAHAPWEPRKQAKKSIHVEMGNKGSLQERLSFCPSRGGVGAAKVVYVAQLRRPRLVHSRRATNNGRPKLAYSILVERAI